jgi:hypothetical protein
LLIAQMAVFYVAPESQRAAYCRWAISLAEQIYSHHAYCASSNVPKSRRPEPCIWVNIEKERRLSSVDKEEAKWTLPRRMRRDNQRYTVGLCTYDRVIMRGRVLSDWPKGNCDTRTARSSCPIGVQTEALCGRIGRKCVALSIVAFGSEDSKRSLNFA